MEYYNQLIAQLAAKGLNRQLSQTQPGSGGFCEYEGMRLLNLSSNDYLGLAQDEVLKKEFTEQLVQHPEWLQLGACSSRLLTGNYNLYDAVEEVLRNLYQTGAALFFNSGYHANMGILPALSDKRDLIVSDKLVHASLIDGVRLSQATHIRYRHLDYQHLDDLLAKRRHQFRHVFIVTESIFSMDGDEADLRLLCDLKEKHDAILYVDEAHALGVKGNTGLGLCEVHQVTDRIDIIVGTMGKALASTGAFAVLNGSLKQYLVNKARTLIFTTALPPVNLAWSKLVLEKMPAFTAERAALDGLARQLQAGLYAEGMVVPASHIMPVMVGDNETTIKLAHHLRKLGFLVFPIRPPTVPENTARLRLSLTADMDAPTLEPVARHISDFLNQQAKTH